ARGPLAAWTRPLRESPARVWACARPGAPQVRWLISVVAAAAIVIGVAGAFEAIVGQRAASSAALAPDATLGATPGEPSPARGPASGTTPRVLLDEQFADSPGNWPSNPQSTAWLADGAYHILARVPGQSVAVGAPVGPV